ncbi:hypothetical protein LshimejAT787_1201570 [Lyophyllum shimeji]|uniref:Aminoglycoside phosphotransferase domain-containing protein n=1 Tax=Lyophyllum shimeji TaxID=47721 RepID=A0A9P3PW65_LYOSH|nr:hypothetical protein LshimejAT787_1201570 [Lyophyllum shimeji]
MALNHHRYILRQLTDMYVAFERHPFFRTGSIYPGELIGAFADRLTYESNNPGQIRMLGPYISLREHLDYTIAFYLRLIESSDWAVDDPVSSYLLYHLLLDLYPRLVGSALLDGDNFYLRRQDDKGDHILVNDQLDIVGIIDWECSKVVAKPFAFSAALLLLPNKVFDGVNRLCQVEEDFADIFDSLGRPDMALCIRHGRVPHRIVFILDSADRIDYCKPHLKGLYQSLGEETWSWESWRTDALQRYRTDPGLQHLLGEKVVI